jgi:ATP-binding cassette, subfamily B, multidrug efflux pump
MRKKILWFWRHYRHFPWVLAVLVVLTPVQAMFTTYSPRLMQFSIDYVKSGQMPDTWVGNLVINIGRSLGLPPETALPLAYIALGLVAFALYAFVQGHRAWMNRRLDWAFRQDAFDRMTDKGPDFFNRFRAGDLVTRLTDDIEGKLSWFACSGIFRLYEALLMVTFTIIMMMNLDPWLTLLTAGPMPLLIFVFFRSSRLLDKRYEHLQTSISNFSDVIEACFSGVRVVKAYVQETAQRRKFDAALGKRRDAEIAAIRAGTIVDSLYGYIWQFGIIIVLLAGGAAVIRAELSAGQLFAFVYYVIFLFFPMFDIGQFLVKSLQSGVSIGRLVELENVAPMVAEAAEPVRPAEVKGGLSLQEVSFSFAGLERNIIDHVSLEIEPGQTVAVVGRVGAGKTWLVNMIPRLVDPTGGQILLDGHPLKMLSLAELRSYIGFVPQEPTLFTDTVRNNILFGRSEVTDDLLAWSIEVAQLKDEVARFPKGLETMIGTRGMAISGGQKQRLALARALVGKPKILILDDCTSALDSRTEAALWDRLHEVMPGMTAVLITHRPDTLQRVDRIFVLEAGRVAESGTHAELLAREGVYYKIYRRFQLEEQVTE